MAKSKYLISNTPSGVKVSVDNVEMDNQSREYAIGLEYSLSKGLQQGKSLEADKNVIEKMYPKIQGASSGDSRFKPKGVPSQKGKYNPVDHMSAISVNGRGKAANFNPSETNREKNLANQKVKSASYDGLYTKYYSSSDFNIYIGDILIDRAAGVGISESLTSSPIYTIGNSRYDFLARGNVIVSGIIRINKAEKNYLAKAISHYRNRSIEFKFLSPYEQIQLTSEELANYRKKLKEYNEGQVSAKSVLDWADLGDFTIHMVYNNSDPVTEGVQQRISIVECRIVGYEHSVDIGSDGQLIDGYKFIAKEVIPE
jgi:hypothetical protein|nr:MAG TPA: hypothetical protein [Caudoviricetes sp.]